MEVLEEAYSKRAALPRDISNRDVAKPSSLNSSCLIIITMDAEEVEVVIIAMDLTMII